MQETLFQGSDASSMSGLHDVPNIKEKNVDGSHDARAKISYACMLCDSYVSRRGAPRYLCGFMVCDTCLSTGVGEETCTELA